MEEKNETLEITEEKQYKIVLKKLLVVWKKFISYLIKTMNGMKID